jgi:hypothetical protein
MSKRNRHQKREQKKLRKLHRLMYKMVDKLIRTNLSLKEIENKVGERFSKEFLNPVAYEALLDGIFTDISNKHQKQVTKVEEKRVSFDTFLGTINNTIHPEGIEAEKESEKQIDEPNSVQNICPAS